MAIQVRRGNEVDFDPSNMLPGEWAVSTDAKYVRMCFAPGIVVRMATYENFEEDLEKIQSILTKCREIESAVKSIQSIVSSKASLTLEYSNNAEVSAKNAKASEDKAKMYADNAQAVTNVQIATTKTAGLVKGGDNLIGEDGELILTRTITDRTLENSCAGGLRIESVAGESVQESTTGAQLLDYPTFKTVGVSKGTAVFENNGVTITATSNDAYTEMWNSDKFAISVNEGEVVTVSWETDDTNSGLVYIFGNGGTTSRNIDSASGIRKLSYTIPSGITFVTFRFGVTNAGDTIHYKNIMINKGSDPLPWEPYTGGQPSPSPSYPQEIESSVVSEIKVVGKNLLDISQFAKGTIGEYGADGDYGACGRGSNFIPVKPNTQYTFHANRTLFNMRINEYTFEKEGLPRIVVSGTRKMTITTTKDTHFLRWSAVYDNTTLVTKELYETLNLQIEEGAVATNYKPYQSKTINLSEPITLNGKGEAKDRIVKQDGVWGVGRKIGVYRLDGTYHWGLTDAGKTGERFGVQTPIKRQSGNDLGMSTHFKYTKQVTTMDNSIYVYTTGWIDVKTSKFTSAEEFKQFLIAQEVYVYYPLATPTFEALPEVDQIALHSLVTYDTVTHLSTDSKIEPVIEVEYGTSKVGGHSLDALNTAKRNEINIKLLNQLTTDLAVTMAEREE